jgi:hypothetical protein
MALGASNAADAMKAATIVNDHIIEFGAVLGEDPTNGLWRATVWQTWNG